MNDNELELLTRRNDAQARQNVAELWSNAACWVAFWGMTAFLGWVCIS